MVKSEEVEWKDIGLVVVDRGINGNLVWEGLQPVTEGKKR